MKHSYQKDPIVFYFTLFFIIITSSSTLSANAKFAKEPVTKTLQQLNNITLLTLPLQNSSLTSYRDFISSRSSELDLTTLDPKLKGVTIIIIPSFPDNHPQKQPIIIDYQAKNVSISPPPSQKSLKKPTMTSKSPQWALSSARQKLHHSLINSLNQEAFGTPFTNTQKQKNNPVRKNF